MNKYEYNVSDFINKQLSKGNIIIECGFDSRGAWEGCTGTIKFKDGTHIEISDTVIIFDKENNEIFGEIIYTNL